MPSKIRVGTVGATVTTGGSGWGAHAHVPALQSIPDYELKAVCTAHSETARASAEAFGAELAFDNFDAMLVNPDTTFDIARGIQDVLVDADLRQRLIAAGKEQALRFNWLDTARNVLELYESVARRRFQS